MVKAVRKRELGQTVYDSAKLASVDKSSYMYGINSGPRSMVSAAMLGFFYFVGK